MKKNLLLLMMLTILNANAQKNISVSLISPSEGELIYNSSLNPNEPKYMMLIQYKLTNLGVPLTNQDTIYATFSLEGEYPKDTAFNIIRFAYIPPGTIATNGSVDVTVTRMSYVNHPKKLDVPFCLVTNLKGDTGQNATNNISCRNINMGIPAGLSALTEAARSLKVYPNPAIDMLNIEIDYTHPVNVMITDGTGRLMDRKTFEDNYAKIQLAGYHKGIYFYQVQNESGEMIKSGKFAVN